MKHWLSGISAPFSRPAGRPLTEDVLTSRPWQFRNEAGQVMANAMWLRAGGGIAGYAHPNERAWRLAQGRLELLDEHGVPSSILELTPDTPYRLRGRFLRGDAVHILEVLPQRPVRYPLHLAWCEAFDDFLERKQIFLGPKGMIRGVHRAGASIILPRPALLEPRTTVSGGHFYSSGYHSYAIGPELEPGAVAVGRYTSIAKGVEVMGAAHPVERVSTHPFTYAGDYKRIALRDFGKRLQQEDFARRDPAPVMIGNDVWIGADVLLKGGITIGDGAVIAARSVVTHDVPDYAMVGGAPARLIRMRFPPEQIARFQRLQWWRYNFVDLPPCWSDVERFLNAAEAAVAAGRLKPFQPECIDIGEALAGIALAQGTTGLRSAD